MDDDEEDNYYKNHIEVDLRDRGYLNPIRAQEEGECCYAFAACDGIAYLHHKKQRGQRRVILSPQDLYNNLVFGPNENDEEEEGDDDDDDDSDDDDADEDEDGDEDDDENDDDDDDDSDDDDADEDEDGDDENGAEDDDEDGDEGHGKYINETLNWTIENGCVLKETCPYKFGVVEPPEPLDDRQVIMRLETSIPLRREDIEDHIRRKGPVLVAVEWINEMNYLGAEDVIYTGPVEASAFKKSDGHALLVVGFGPDYWLVRNSHGTQWANHGYAKFTREQVHGRFLINDGWGPVGITYEDRNGGEYPRLN